jgi:hypothetical protein
MYSENLKNYLNQNSHVNKIYMNEEGGWLFYPHPSYKIEVLVSEIFENKEIIIEEKPIVKEVKKTKK